MTNTGLDRADAAVYVRPIQALGRTALLSGAFSLVPVFAAVLYLTRLSGAWLFVALGEAVVTIVFFVVFVRFKRVFTAVTATHFVKRRMLLPPVAIDRRLVDRIVVNRVYRGGSTETLTQMLGVDAMGRRLFGMNALFWTDDDIKLVTDALEVQTIIDTQAMPRSDYFAAFPVARGWYLSRVLLVGALVVAAALIIAAVVVIEGIVGTR